MKYVTLFLGLIFLISACAGVQQRETLRRFSVAPVDLSEQAKSNFQKEIRQLLKDPDSAKFGSMYYSLTTKELAILCLGQRQEFLRRLHG